MDTNSSCQNIQLLKGENNQRMKPDFFGLNLFFLLFPVVLTGLGLIATFHSLTLGVDY